MKKTIKIDNDHAVTLSSNNGWLFIYKDQFGRDIVPMLVPALNAGVQLALTVYQATGGAVDRKALASIDPDDVTSAMWSISGIEAVDLLNVLWAMAKNADDDIPEPREWLNSFEVFPLDEVIPQVFDLLAQSYISGKNLTRLQAARESLKPER